MAGVVATVSEVSSTVMGALMAIPEAVKDVVGALRSFTDAISPQAGLNFDRAVRSVEATIGSALLPVLALATEVMDRFAGAVMGAMGAMRGSFEQIAALTLDVMQPVFVAVSAAAQVLADALRDWLPVITEIALALGQFAALLAVAVTALGALAAAVRDFVIGSYLGGLGKSMDWLKGLFVELGKTVIFATLGLLKMAGRTDVAKDFLEGIARGAGPPTRGLTPAPLDYRLGTMMDVYQRQLLEAAKGGGPTVAEESRDYLKEIRDFAEKQLAALEKGEPGPLPAGAAAALTPAIGAMAGLRWVERGAVRTGIPLPPVTGLRMGLQWLAEQAGIQL